MAAGNTKIGRYLSSITDVNKGFYSVIYTGADYVIHLAYEHFEDLHDACWFIIRECRFKGMPRTYCGYQKCYSNIVEAKIAAINMIGVHCTQCCDENGVPKKRLARNE